MLMALKASYRLVNKLIQVVNFNKMPPCNPISSFSNSNFNVQTNQVVNYIWESMDKKIHLTVGPHPIWGSSAWLIRHISYHIWGSMDKKIHLTGKTNYCIGAIGGQSAQSAGRLCKCRQSARNRPTGVCPGPGIDGLCWLTSRPTNWRYWPSIVTWYYSQSSIITWWLNTSQDLREMHRSIY